MLCESCNSFSLPVVFSFLESSFDQLLDRTALINNTNGTDINTENSVGYGLQFYFFATASVRIQLDTEGK